MALDKTVSYTGQNQVDTLSSRLRIEEGKGYLVIYDGTVNRLIMGVLPDGSIGMVISKEGVDVFSVFS